MFSSLDLFCNLFLGVFVGLFRCGWFFRLGSVFRRVIAGF